MVEDIDSGGASVAIRVFSEDMVKALLIGRVLTILQHYHYMRPPLITPDEELFELTEDGRLHDHSNYQKTKYEDGSSIDWLREESAERQRIHAQRSQRGIRGLLLPWMDSARMWLVIVLTGIGIGLTGAWLDVLVKWYAHDHLIILFECQPFKAGRFARGSLHIRILLQPGRML